MCVSFNVLCLLLKTRDETEDMYYYLPGTKYEQLRTKFDKKKENIWYMFAVKTTEMIYIYMLDVEKLIFYESIFIFYAFINIIYIFIIVCKQISYSIFICWIPKSNTC